MRSTLGVGPEVSDGPLVGSSGQGATRIAGTFLLVISVVSNVVLFAPLGCIKQGRQANYVQASTWSLLRSGQG